MNKIITREEAIEKITDGARIMVGGFGLVGSPLSLIEAIAKSNLKDLEIISNNLGEPGKGLGVLVQKKQVKKAKSRESINGCFIFFNVYTLFYL